MVMYLNTSAASPVLCSTLYLPFVFSLTWAGCAHFPHDHLSAFLMLCASSGIIKWSKYISILTLDSAFSYQHRVLLPSQSDFGMRFYIIDHFLGISRLLWVREVMGGIWIFKAKCTLNENTGSWAEALLNWEKSIPDWIMFLHMKLYYKEGRKGDRKEKNKFKKMKKKFEKSYTAKRDHAIQYAKIWANICLFKEILTKCHFE